MARHPTPTWRHRGPRQEHRTRRSAPQLPRRAGRRRRRPRTSTRADAEAAPAAAKSRRAAQVGRPGRAGEPTARPRPSITAAFRGAFRPLDLRGDIKALPRLLIHIAFLIPVATIVGITAVIIAFGGKELISRELSQFFLAPPPLVPVFIAGFLAPRASWLLGGLLGVVQTVAVLVIVSTPALGEVVGVPDAERARVVVGRVGDLRRVLRRGDGLVQALPPRRPAAASGPASGQVGPEAEAGQPAAPGPPPLAPPLALL